MALCPSDVPRRCEHMAATRDPSKVNLASKDVAHHDCRRHWARITKQAIITVFRITSVSSRVQNGEVILVEYLSTWDALFLARENSCSSRTGKRTLYLV